MKQVMKYIWLGSLGGEQRAILIRESVWERQSNLPKTRRVILAGEQMEVLLQYKEQYFPEAQPQDCVPPGSTRPRPAPATWSGAFLSL